MFFWLFSFAYLIALFAFCGWLAGLFGLVYVGVLAVRIYRFKTGIVEILDYQKAEIERLNKLNSKKKK